MPKHPTFGMKVNVWLKPNIWKLQQELPAAIGPWPKPRRKENWREAEEYFRQNRDRKLKVSLPRVSIQHQELEEEAA